MSKNYIRADSQVYNSNEINANVRNLADCINTNSEVKVSITSDAPATHGLATAANQDLVINASLRDINNTGAIGDGSSQHSAMCLGYDRSNGQGRSLLVDANGTLETNVNMNTGHGLATEAKQDDIINATNRAINNTGSIGDGSTNATVVALGYDRTNGKGRAILVDDGGNVNVAPAASVNSGITNDPTNSVAVGLRARTDIADAATETFLLTDSDGHLKVDVISSAGGDTVIKGNDGNDGSGTDRVVKTDANGVVLVNNSANTQPVSGTITANAGSGTFAVSAASLPLPSGAATSAKQPALGTAGSASADVITVQGVGSMTPLLVNNSANTQPVSGTITANAGSGTFAVEQSYSYSSDFTVINAVSIADGANSTSAAFEVQSVKVEDPIITFTVDAGGSTNYDVQAIGSHDGTNFFDIGFAKSFTQSEMSSTSDMGLKVPRYMKFKISNNHGSGSHTFTLKAAVLGATLATP